MARRATRHLKRLLDVVLTSVELLAGNLLFCHAAPIKCAGTMDGVPTISTDREKIVADCAEDSFLYCIHCERTYQTGQYREQDFPGLVTLQMCPYDGCDGDAVIDAWSWASIRSENPDYPEIPEEGIVYPMYGGAHVQ